MGDLCNDKICDNCLRVQFECKLYQFLDCKRYLVTYSCNPSLINCVIDGKQIMHNMHVSILRSQQIRVIRFVHVRFLIGDNLYLNLIMKLTDLMNL